MKSFRDLEVWSKAHEVTLSVYQITANYPKDELYGLTSQMRRCSASVAANIAEGCGRSGNGDFHRFLQIAMGSASELEYHLLLSRDLGFLKNQDFQHLTTETQRVKKMLASLIRKVGEERSVNLTRV